MGFAKNYSLLEDVSKYFTEETLKEIMAMMCDGKNIEVLGWDFGDASAKGDSYLSTVNKIKVSGKVDGEEKQVSIVVKSLPNNMGRRRTYRSAEFFYNEITFYTKVIPKFEEFLKAKEQSQVLCVPRHLASVIDGENDFLALEDVSVIGFGPVSRLSGTSSDQCYMMLKAMAKFHAISFAYKDQKKAEFSQMQENLIETYFCNKHWGWYKNFHKKLVGIAIDALTKEYPDSAALKTFTSIPFGELFSRCAEFCGRRNAATSVINQGDSWAPNFLTRKTEEKQEALMLDFQLARCVSPVLDLSFCIYACTDKKLRDEAYDNMLDVYYNELAHTIKILGSNPEKIYSRDTFMTEVKQQSMFGMVFATEALPFSLLDETEAFDLDTLIKGDEAVDIATVWQLTNIQTQSGRRRLADVIVHAVDRGYLQA